MNIKDLIIMLKDRDIDEKNISKMLYLIDWKYTLVYGNQLTNANWFYDNFGANFKIENQDMLYYIKNLDKHSIFSEPLSQIDHIRIQIFINFIEEKFERMLYTDLMHMYFSTYPFFVTDKYDLINMENSREKYLDFLFETKYKNISEIVGLKTNNEIKTKDDIENWLIQNYTYNNIDIER